MQSDVDSCSLGRSEAARAAAFVAVPCLRIQICDGPTGCGRVVENVYECAQMCDYRRHPEFVQRVTGPNAWQNAPYMRCAVVAEVVGLPLNASVSGRVADHEHTQETR